ncbi:MAG: hypothetical protein Q4G71_07160 [Pseudomonadota bacterium]|nr:hypothetical protein [Pseudomonadota bacterium]
MSATRAKPARWQGADDALRAVQVAFDVEERVMEAIRVAAFHAHVSTSTQIRQVLGLPVPAERPKRPRLTVTLSGDDYALLAARYGLDADDRLAIKEAATRELIDFVPRRKNSRAAGREGRENAAKDAKNIIE